MTTTTTLPPLNSSSTGEASSKKKHLNTAFNYEDAIADLSPSLFDVTRLSPMILPHYEVATIAYELIAYQCLIYIALLTDIRHRATGQGAQVQIGIVGGEGMIGQEIVAALRAHAFPSRCLHLASRNGKSIHQVLDHVDILILAIPASQFRHFMIDFSQHRAREARNLVILSTLLGIPEKRFPYPWVLKTHVQPRLSWMSDKPASDEGSNNKISRAAQELVRWEAHDAMASMLEHFQVHVTTTRDRDEHHQTEVQQHALLWYEPILSSLRGTKAFALD